MFLLCVFCCCFLFSFFFLYFCALIDTSGKGDVQVCFQGNFLVSSVFFCFFLSLVVVFLPFSLSLDTSGKGEDVQV